MYNDRQELNVQSSLVAHACIISSAAHSMPALSSSESDSITIASEAAGSLEGEGSGGAPSVASGPAADFSLAAFASSARRSLTRLAC